MAKPEFAVNLQSNKCMTLNLRTKTPKNKRIFFSFSFLVTTLCMASFAIGHGEAGVRRTPTVGQVHDSQFENQNAGGARASTRRIWRRGYIFMGHAQCCGFGFEPKGISAGSHVARYGYSSICINVYICIYMYTYIIWRRGYIFMGHAQCCGFGFEPKGISAGSHVARYGYSSICINVYICIYI